MQIISVLFIYSKPRLNNICIYAEVIALARFFLELLLSPQILNIQLSSPDQSWGQPTLPGKGWGCAGGARA
jgi:hypothetical protein